MAYPISPMILVVGRQAEGRVMVAQILEQAGMRVKESGAPETDLHATRGQEFQLVVSVDLPEAEGRALFGDVQDSFSAATVPVLYLAASQVPEGAAELVANIRALLRVHDAEQVARARLQDMIRLHEVTTSLTAASADLETTLHEVLAAVLELQQAPLGAMMLYDENNLWLYPVARIGIGVDFESCKDIERLPPGFGASGTAFADHRSVVVEDVLVEPRYADFLNIAETAGYRAVFSVPLLTRQDTVLGVITSCWRQPHRPSDWDIRLVELYARQVASAIENSRLRRQVLEEEHNKDEFLAMLAHELRNPLAPIQNAAHMIRLQAPGNDTLAWAIGMVERQARHLTHLVDDLLDVSRITRGKIELHREPVTLRTVMQNVAEANRGILAEREHQLTVELPDETIWMDADPTRLEQIFSNLLHNAAKYTPRGGQVALKAAREQASHEFPQGAVRIQVIDNGIGIAPEMLRRVFDVFSQAERTLDRAEGGLGLGLTLVRRLTEMHCGKVEAHSPGLGRGSEFLVRLPLAPLSPETFEARPHNERQDELDEMFQGRGQGRRVLVIDDQVDTAQSMAELLEIWGHQVRVGYDGTSAVELAAEFHPEVVLLDIGLPLMNGYEVARQLRQMAGHDMTLVAVTGYGQEEDRRRAMEAGFDLHMTKPVDLGSLRELIGSASHI